jgi:hypothetical protein
MPRKFAAASGTRVKSLFKGTRMDRRAELAATLDRVAKWTAALFAVGFVCLIAIGIIYRRIPPPGAVLAASVLTFIGTVTGGFVSLSAFALRDAIEARGRFSLRTLLIATTWIALVLGLIAWATRWI